MNAVGTSVWSRLLAWLEHTPPADGYRRLKLCPSLDEPQLLELLDGGAAEADASFAKIAHRIRAARILFVPALFSGIALKASRLKLVDYLTEQVRHLRCEGFDAEIAEIDTGAAIKANGERLAQILEARHRPTWVITHSKGGLDVLQALVARPDVMRYVEGWVAFQAPFWGSPVADVASGSARAQAISRRALKLLGSDIDVVADLSTHARAQYMERHMAQIAAIVRSVPLTCVASIADGISSRLRPDWPTTRWMNGLGLANDGLVPVHSSVLPGARYTVLQGLAHGEVAAHRMLSNRWWDHVDLLKALFVLTLRDERATRDAAA